MVAQADDRAAASLGRQPAKRSYLVAYALWLFLGIFGAHRYYLGRWLSGFIYTVTLGLLFIGWAIDLILVATMVARQRRAVAEGTAKPGLFSLLTATGRERAPWAERRRLFGAVDLLFAGIAYVIVPALVIVVAAYLDLYEIAVLILVIMVVAGLLGPLHSTLQGLDQLFIERPSLARIPFLPDVLITIKGFNDHYFQHRPHNVLYYVLYPVVGLPALLFSKTARSEFRLFQGLFMIALVTAIIETLLNYNDHFAPYLGPGEAFLLVVVTPIVVLIFMPVTVMPAVTAAFRFKYAGHQNALRVLTLCSLLVTALMIQSLAQDEDFRSYPVQFRVDAKLAQAEFREDLTVVAEMFLGYQLPRLNPAGDEAGILRDADLTERFRSQLGGVLPDERERRVFDIMRSGGAGDPMLLVRYYSDTENTVVVLFAMGADRRLLSKWSELSPVAREQLTVVGPATVVPGDKTEWPDGAVTRAMMMSQLAEVWAP